MDLAGFGTLALAVIIIFVLYTSFHQYRLGTAHVYRDQANAWRELADDWRVLLLVGHGPEYTEREEFDSSFVEPYKKGSSIIEMRILITST